MKITNIGNYNSIEAFVENKLASLERAEKSFANLYELMFSEKENIMFEKSEGYRIVKTTYGQAQAVINSKAGSIKNMLKDCKADSVVGLYMDNSIEWIENFWAILKAGFRPLLMNLRLDTELLESALRDVEAVAVIAEGKEFSVKTIPSSMIEASVEALSGASFGSEIMVMSSGTSSSIKICAYSAEEFYCQINDSYHIIKQSKLIKTHYEGQLKLLTFLPFYHVFGLIAVYLWFSFFSRTFVQLNDMAPNTIVNTIRRHKVTHIFAVPMFWEKVYAQAIKTIKDRGESTYKKFKKGLRIAGKLEGTPGLGKTFKKKSFKEVRENLFGESIVFLITGGSEISPEVMRFFNGIGYHLADGYGMTEIGITSVELSNKPKLLNACFVGKPFSSMEYKIAENGELLVRGSAMAKYIIEGGVKMPREDWFHTRDLAECVKGHYRILGRLDDVVIGPSGENLNPNLVEPLFTIDQVEKACLIADKSGGQVVPTLLISVNRSITTDELVSLDVRIKELLAASSYKTQISKLSYTRESLLSEQDFKLKRESIAKRYSENGFKLLIPGKEEAVELKDDEELCDRIRVLVATALGKKKEAVRDDMDFFLEGGGSSLDYFALCSEMSKEFGIDIPVAGENTLKTVNDFYEYLKAKGL